MTIREITGNVLPAILICAVTVLTTGCPLRTEGEITTKDGGGGSGSIAKGTWCCKSATTKKGTGCIAMPSGSTASACPSGGGGPSVLLDCTTNSVDNAGTVTCD